MKTEHLTISKGELLTYIYERTHFINSQIQESDDLSLNYRLIEALQELHLMSRFISKFEG